MAEKTYTYESLRNGLLRLSQDRGHWAGYPMPLPGERLIMEPTYPYADKLDAAQEAMLQSEAEERGIKPPLDEVQVKVRADRYGRLSGWENKRHAKRIIPYEELDNPGRVKVHISHRVSRTSLWVRTLTCSRAWGIEQELNALNLLGSMVAEHRMNTYLLTGSFLEKSRRSGILYVFRRLRPTIALRETENDYRTLCALCLHPIAYYDDSWAGGMCPTDDVIAHLAMMRGDEHMFWKRCNQHHVDSPEAGV